MIINITDDGAHGKEYSNDDKFTEEGPKLTSLIKEIIGKNINIIWFKIGKDLEQSF